VQATLQLKFPHSPGRTVRFEGPSIITAVNNQDRKITD